MTEFFGIDLPALIRSVGYVGLFIIIFAESGLFIGFFLPGDSLLFTAGFLASQGILNIFILVPLCFIAAILGDSFGYFFGKKIGPALFNKERSFFFHKENLERARMFYERYGAKTIFLARFLPVVRTFAPILAGVGEMRYRTFMIYNFIGALVWGIGITIFGYYLGSIFPQAEKYLLYIVAAIIALSALPSLIHVIRNRETFFNNKK
ncbi:VTT domain-containing protein [Candidatus Giovannonibacteria bacterium]|nr:VTT domain-containing protein [Candidatus Giovannonibacteria bacterium]